MTAAGASGATPLSKRAGQLVIAGLLVALVVTPAVFVPRLYDDFTLIKQSALLLATAIVLVGLALAGFPLPAPRAVRLSLAAWVALLLLSEALAIDPRGSVLGVYQYRQGFLTQVAYVVLFLGAAHVGSQRKALLERFVLAGGTAVLAYTAIQAVGLDPIDWWLDTSDRAIGTIGNANELAAYAVIALVALPAATRIDSRRGPVLTACIAAAVCFVVFESESRSGLGALVLDALLVPVAWLLSGNPVSKLRRPAGFVLSGFLLGATLSFAAGSLPETAGRIQGGVTGAGAGGSTRLALWEGTLGVIKANPIHGAGPDGLFLAFPVDRPGNLGGAFESYDLVAQSGHNLVLDTAANYGLPALGALAALVATVCWHSVRRVRSRQRRETPSDAPWAWSALAAYGALTLLNPVSLAAHAVFFFALGVMVADGQPASTTRLSRMHPAVRILAVGPGVGALLAVTVALPLADLSANDGWNHYAANEFDAAADDYRSAAKLMPFERRYATDHARALLAAGVGGPPARLEAANRALTDLDRDFGFTSGDAFAQATARIGLGEDADRVNPLIERAVKLNPHGVATEWYAGQLRMAAASGGILRYSERDRWVFVEPLP